MNHQHAQIKYVCIICISHANFEEKSSVIGNDICHWLTCTTSISAKVYCKEFGFVFKPEIVVWSIGGGVILRDQRHVQLEACVSLIDYIEDFSQTQPVFTFRDTDQFNAVFSYLRH